MITKFNESNGIKSGATFSECERYRYGLVRQFNPLATGNLLFIMLNPSTADEMKNDPTIERCQRRAAAMGFGSIAVANLFAFRATDPKDMKQQEDPVGESNNMTIVTMAKRADMIICGWGTHGAYRGRADEVLELLKGFDLFALKITKHGFPQHPLYVGYDVGPVVYRSQRC